ncbi:MAG: hypothetical protein BRD41_05340 [Bacteroidetes bacterium QS_1_63_11]|nr:MAG: hypothetical protein BRD41_05340 [Bacteroidetes bacterium QS_1_63_11]
MDGENAFHMFNEVASEAFERGDADWFIHSLTRLEERQPETYAAEVPYLLSRHLKAAEGDATYDNLRHSAARSSTPCGNFPPIPPWCATWRQRGKKL